MWRLWIFLLLLLAACDPEPTVAFTEPLPVGSADLTQFPRRHRGVYALRSDTLQHVVVLRRAVVFRGWGNFGRKSRHTIDSLRHTTNDAGQPPKLRLVDAQPDSATVLWQVTDTVFQLTTPDSTRLRRKGGLYYLNRARPTGYWETKKLRLRDHQLQLTAFTTDSLRLAALRQAGLLERVTDQPNRYLARLTLRNQARLLRDPTLWPAANDSVYERQCV